MRYPKEAAWFEVDFLANNCAGCRGQIVECFVDGGDIFLAPFMCKEFDGAIVIDSRILTPLTPTAKAMLAIVDTEVEIPF